MASGRVHSPASRLLRMSQVAKASPDSTHPIQLSLLLLNESAISCRSRLAGEHCGSDDIAASGQMHSPASRLLRMSLVAKASPDSTHPIQLSLLHLNKSLFGAVGAGLLANPAGQTTLQRLERCIRQQAGSFRFYGSPGPHRTALTPSSVENDVSFAVRRKSRM